MIIEQFNVVSVFFLSGIGSRANVVCYRLSCVHVSRRLLRHIILIFQKGRKERKKLHTPHDFFVQSEEKKFFGMRKHHFLTLIGSCTSEYHVHLVETSRK